MKKLFPILAIAAITVFASCTKDEDNNNDNNNNQSGLQVPAAYDSSNYTANIATVGSIRTNFDAMITEVRKGRTSGTVSASALLSAYNAGSPSLKSLTTNYFDNILTGPQNWFMRAETASGGVYNPDSAGSAGAFGGYMFDTAGYEPEQIIEKGMFGATLVNEAYRLLSGNPTLAQIDQALHIIGANPHFRSSSNATKHGAAADRYFSVYVARRDKNDGNGFYSQMRFNFIKLQAAVKGGTQYNRERDEAIAAIKDILERANAATIINYCHTSIALLSQTTVTDAQRATALHAIGECHGFAWGWKTISGKRITDAQLDEIMELLNAPVAGGGRPVLFLTDRVNQIGKLQQIITKVQNIYSFNATQIEDFRSNWIVVQDR
jgi:hypothetical protein